MRIHGQIPKVLGGYRLVRQLGRGGMAEVWLAYKAEDPLEKPWVIKVLLPEYVGSAKHRERFLLEVKTLASLRHGRIVAIHDFGEDQGFLYLVMDYIDGVNLQVFVRALEAKGERLPIPAVLYILCEVADALRHAHDRTRAGAPRGVIHRDVKPSNVLVSSEGEVFLTDFGLARYEKDFSFDIFGTSGYVAPEQARGAACPQSDVFGLGGILHFMLTGEPTRRAPGGMVLDSVLDDPPPPTGRDDVPEAVEKLRVMCLEPSLARRFESAADVVRIIEKSADHQRCAMMIKQYHLRYFGPPRTGTTEALAMAKAAEPREPTLEVEPPPQSWAEARDDEDLTTFWQPPAEVAADAGSTHIPPEYRPTPVVRTEPDAPRIRRRPRRDGSPASPPQQLERTELLSPPFAVEPRVDAERQVVVALDEVSAGEVELGGRRLVQGGRVLLPLGRHSLRWRAMPSAAWRHAGVLDLDPKDAAGVVRVYVSPTGCVQVERHP